MEDLDNGRGLIDSDKYYQVPGQQGLFVIGDIVRPHLLTTAIGQAWVAAESIDHYLKREDLGKRPKVDVHHFDLLEKLKETGLAPEPYCTPRATSARKSRSPPRMSSIPTRSASSASTTTRPRRKPTAA